MVCVERPSRNGKSFDAGDVGLCCHEFKKASHMVMEGDSRLFIFSFTGLFFIKIGFSTLFYLQSEIPWNSRNFLFR
jgi:hypothetical protein